MFSAYGLYRCHFAGITRLDTTRLRFCGEAREVILRKDRATARPSGWAGNVLSAM